MVTKQQRLASQRVSPGGGGWAQRHAQDADLGPMLGEAGAGLQDPEQVEGGVGRQEDREREAKGQRFLCLIQGC